MVQDSWRKFLSRETHERVALDIPETSLLFPPGKAQTSTVGDATWQEDIGLGDLVAALVTDRRYMPFVRRTLAALVADAQVIAWRQAVFADFLKNPALVEAVSDLLPHLASLREGNALLGGRTRSLLLETSDRLAELDLYTEVVQSLHDALAAADLQAEALVTLRDALAVLLADEHFQDLRAQLPELRAPLQDITSLTVGINLDYQLQPVSAVLLAINDYKLTEQVSMLERLIGTRREEGDESGIAPLKHVPRDRELRKYDPLFQDLNDLMTRVAQPIAQALRRYIKTSGDTLAQLEYEFAFFLAGVRYVRQLEKLGVTLCRPETAPAKERLTRVEGLVNASLVLRTGGKR